MPGNSLAKLSSLSRLKAQYLGLPALMLPAGGVSKHPLIILLVICSTVSGDNPFWASVSRSLAFTDDTLAV